MPRRPPARILGHKLLVLLRESPKGRLRLSGPSLVWAIAERWPRSPRPRLCEIERAISWLRSQGKVRLWTDLLHGGRIIVPAEGEEHAKEG